jgi:hypothetical protein
MQCQRALVKVYSICATTEFQSLIKPFIPTEAGQVMEKAKHNEGVGLDVQGNFAKELESCSM